MKHIQYDKSDHLVTIGMNKTETLNALDMDLLAELREAWERYSADADAWMAIITGSGRSFSVGADRSWFERGLQGGDFLGPFFDEIGKDPYFSGRLDKPVIAAVNGFALGAGMDLALRADLRVASESAVFQIVEVRLGGVLVQWDNLPFALASELMAGRKISGRRAYEMGLVNEVVADGNALAAATRMARDLLTNPPLALHHSLRLARGMRRAAVPNPSDLLQKYSMLLGKELVRTEDWKEANTPGNKNPIYKGR